MMSGQRAALPSTVLESICARSVGVGSCREDSAGPRCRLAAALQHLVVLDLVEIADVGGRTRRDTQPVEQQQANQGVIRWTGGLGVLEGAGKTNDTDAPGDRGGGKVVTVGDSSTALSQAGDPF